MKKIKIVGIAVVFLSAVSCNKFVDYKAQEDYVVTTDDYFKTASDYQSLLVGCYTPLQWMWYAPIIGDIASDNAMCGGESATNEVGLQQIHNFQVVPNNSSLTELWTDCYEGINRVNYLYQNRGLLEFTGKEELYGEAYFLRSYYYFELVRLFGGVPLFIDHKLTVSDSKQMKRFTKAEVYKQIEADLNNAITTLPKVQTDKGRATLFSAEALLGKVYLYENKFDSAAAVFERVINSGLFTLTPNLADVFLQAGENGSESLFEVQYTNLDNQHDWGTNNVLRSQGNMMVEFCGIRKISGTGIPYAGGGYSFDLPTKELESQFSETDTRKNAAILDVAAYAASNPSLGITYGDAPYQNTGLYNQKYQPRIGETSSAGVSVLNYLNNYRVIRYADVLLMAAEANNRATIPNDVKAQGYLKLVRHRAYGDDSHAPTVTGSALTHAIWEERRLELAMEGDRFFDLVRTGQAASKIKGFVVGRNELFPIPQQEIDLSGLAQNPGY